MSTALDQVSQEITADEAAALVRRFTEIYPNCDPAPARRKLEQVAGKLFDRPLEGLTLEQAAELDRHIRSGFIRTEIELFDPPAEPAQLQEQTMSANNGNGKKKLIDMSDKEMRAQFGPGVAGDESGTIITDEGPPDLHAERAKRNGKPQASPLPVPAMNTSDREEQIPLDKIAPSPFNPRRLFDETELKRLAESLTQHGQVQNCVVRVHPTVPGVFELIAGERRMKAAVIAKLRTLRCRVIVADDATAIELAGIENYRREQLNAIEEAQWFEQMIRGAGHTQQQLAEKLGISQGQVANRLGLLKLPPAWRDQIISGEIPATWARELATWVEEPAVLEEMGRLAKARGGIGGKDDFDATLDDAIEHCSRPIKGGFNLYDGDRYLGYRQVAFKPTPAQMKELRLRTVNNEKRAFNLALWQELQDAAESRRQERQAKVNEQMIADDGPRQISPAEKKQHAKWKKDQQDKRLARWLTKWRQARIVARLASASPEILWGIALYFMAENDRRNGQVDPAFKAAIKRTGGKVQASGYSLKPWPSIASLKPELRSSAAVQCMEGWLSLDVESYGSGLSHEVIEAIAGELGVDLASEWRLSKDFLELFTKSDLQALAKEWKFKLTTQKNGEIIQELVELDASKTVPCPKCLLALDGKGAKKRK